MPAHYSLDAYRANNLQAGAQSPFEIMTGNFTDLTGQNIAHYLLERRLGGGAMASVYQATDQILDRTIALKVLMPGADPLTRERFRQEARTVSILDHPHIVRTLQVGQTSADGVAYIAMEIIEGPSLSTLLEQYGTLNMEDTANLLEPIARALAYAHSLGVVHRDVKPSNILLRNVSLNSPGSIQLSVLGQPIKPYLSDFGIARALDSPELTSAGRTIGTPSYMAPEQCAGSREIDGRADIYSLGAVLYRCLVGRPPFVGTTTQILHAHVYEPLTIPDEVINKLPQPMVEILQHSLMKDANIRYHDAATMADALAVVAGRQPNAANAARPATGATQTMNSLPATALEDTGSTSQILVPGAGAANAASNHSWSPHGTPSSVRRVGSTTHSKITRPLPSPGSIVKKREFNWVSLAVGAALLLLLVLVGLAVVSAFLPTPEAEATPPVVVSTPAVPNEDSAATETVSPDSTTEVADDSAAVTAGTSTAAAGATSAVAADSDAATPGANTPTARSGANATSVTATGSPTDAAATTATRSSSGSQQSSGDIDLIEEPPAVSVESTWDDAQYFFKARDWQQAIVYLTLLQRRDPEFKAEQVAAMEVPIYIGLAGEATTAALTAVGDQQEEELSSALAMLDRVVERQPDNKEVSELRDAVEQFAQAPQSQLRNARVALSESYAQFANSLAETDDFCGAAEQMLVAVTILYNADWADQQVRYLEQCPQDEQGDIQAAAGPPTAMSGLILYSSVQGGQNVIWQLPITEAPASTRLVNDGRLPSLSPDGTRLAFLSGVTSSNGIHGADVNRDRSSGLLTATDQFQFTYHAEDSTDSPPQWSPGGDLLIYGSTVDGDRVPRIFYINNNTSGNYLLTGDGREPDWHPTLDLVVFKGADASGNNPGIWLMTHKGGNRQQLTTDQSDARPVWSPDGQTVVFMSHDRDDNWNIYSVDITSKQVVQLTDDAADDGMPAVSPNGEYVAFLSDRLDGWQIWVIPIGGGSATPLAKIAGSLPNWWEHSIQWAP
ncbi:MAG: serine/threonine-protein kinase [Caldilineaceae bacterium]|nr:serine/threonine-protein kinase [Caldilineaceae bacterium]